MANPFDYSDICEVRKLNLLQRLKVFKVNKESTGFELKQLGKMKEIRELGIYNLERIHTKEEATGAKLIDKRYLQKLTLDWEAGLPENERDEEGKILEGLQPHRNLQELSISRHASHSCPIWLDSKSCAKALQSLVLHGVEWRAFPSLGHMRVLRELTLKDICTLKEFGPRHFGVITQQSFCSLKSLTLIGLIGLEKWVLRDDCHLLSRLEVLVIDNCPDLLELPFANSTFYPPEQDKEGKIHWFPNLQEFRLIRCPKVVSLPPIPWTQTLCLVEIRGLGSSVLEMLEYRKSPSNVELRTMGDDDRHSLDEVLAFNNLADLQNLELVRRCPPLELRHLEMLKSLEHLTVVADHAFVQSENEGEGNWQIPVKEMYITSSRVTGKELTQVLSHLPNLHKMLISGSQKITHICVAVEQQQPSADIPPPSASAITVSLEVTQATCHRQKIADVEEIEKVDNDDGLLLLPAHLADSLRKLDIRKCPELSMVASPLPPNNRSRAGGGGGGLQALRSLERLEVRHCPKFASSWFPFPSSLKRLYLTGAMGLRTLEPLANLTSLTELNLNWFGGDLRLDGLWPLVTQGQLSELAVDRSPGFFVGSDPILGLKDEDQLQLLHRSSKLQKLWTDDAAGFLTVPICSILSYSLTNLSLEGDEELVRFTEEQEAALQLLTSLQDLTFFLLPKLQCLPVGLHRLRNLKRLRIAGCELISSLPSDGLPSSLKELDVSRFENKALRQQCENYVDDNPGIKLIL